MMVRDFAVSKSSAQLSITGSAFVRLAGQPQSLPRRKSCGTGDRRGVRVAAYLSWPWRRAIAGVAGNGDGDG